MHTRRIASFLLGIWIGCSGFLALVEYANEVLPTRILATPSDPAAQLIKKLPPEDLQLLLRYEAQEQNRRYSYVWEQAEIALAVVLGASLLLGTEKRVFPIVCCGLMLVLVLFEHFAIGPELSYRGREADFPPGNRVFGTQTRLWALYEVYILVEGAKLLVGAVLASYLFIFRTRRVRKQTQAIGPEDHTFSVGDRERSNARTV